jgi:hypothetical protein
MIIKKGNNSIGDCGINNFKNSKLCVKRPIKKIDKPKVKDKNNIMAIWLVNAIPNGVILIKLHNKTKKNNEKINGK